MKKYLLAAVGVLALGATAASAACFTYGNLYRCEGPGGSQSYGEDSFGNGSIYRQWGSPPQPGSGYNYQAPNPYGGHPAPTMRRWQ
jgi:opacity protein-like surface antigen